MISYLLFTALSELLKEIMKIRFVYIIHISITVRFEDFPNVPENRGFFSALNVFYRKNFFEEAKFAFD